MILSVTSNSASIGDIGETTPDSVINSILSPCYYSCSVSSRIYEGTH